VTSRIPARARRWSSTRPTTARDSERLSRIARRELGDPHRWREIWELNKYRHFGNHVFDDWDHIHKGWVLWLPAIQSTNLPGRRAGTADGE
jgi:hypothetical protein